MKEKVLYVQLPEDAIYRKVIVTEDGRIGIVYSEECLEQSVNVPLERIIPKPEKLVGGTEVYQKEGIPYWYCKIKNGRDEFMHLYTDDLTEKDLLYDSKTGEPRKFTTKMQKKFKDNVLVALENKPKEGFRWIPVFEPSPDGKGRLQFVKGKKPLVGLNCFEWKKLIEEYSPENESAKASIYTYFLQALRWLKDGIATLEQLADNSKGIGHYLDSENAKHDFELTGEREFGGLCGFVGNTCKIVEDPNSESSFSLVGGGCFNHGYSYPLGDVVHINYPFSLNNYSVGWLELKK